MGSVGRTILVGDVHGCADELGDLLDALNFAQGVDALVLVGDLVARGPDSRGAVQRARETGARVVRGNHDEKIVAAHHSALACGNRDSLSTRHQQVLQQLDDDAVAWLANLPLYFPLESHGVLVVHAGIVPGVALHAQDPHLLMNLRSIDAAGKPTRRLEGTPWAETWPGPDHVVFGHDARRGLQLAPHATGLDTGCCYGRALTALVLDAGEPVPRDLEARRARLHSVAARAAHCPMGDGNGAE